MGVAQKMTAPSAAGSRIPCLPMQSQSHRAPAPVCTAVLPFRDIRPIHFHFSQAPFLIPSSWIAWFSLFDGIPARTKSCCFRFTTSAASVRCPWTSTTKAHVYGPFKRSSTPASSSPARGGKKVPESKSLQRHLCYCAHLPINRRKELRRYIPVTTAQEREALELLHWDLFVSRSNWQQWLLDTRAEIQQSKRLGVRNALRCEAVVERLLTDLIQYTDKLTSSNKNY